MIKYTVTKQTLELGSFGFNPKSESLDVASYDTLEEAVNHLIDEVLGGKLVNNNELEDEFDMHEISEVLAVSKYYYDGDDVVDVEDCGYYVKLNEK